MIVLSSTRRINIKVYQQQRTQTDIQATVDVKPQQNAVARTTYNTCYICVGEANTVVTNKEVYTRFPL